MKLQFTKAEQDAADQLTLSIVKQFLPDIDPALIVRANIDFPLMKCTYSEEGTTIEVDPSITFAVLDLYHTIFHMGLAAFNAAKPYVQDLMEKHAVINRMCGAGYELR